jgi:hypothetical protein
MVHQVDGEKRRCTLNHIAWLLQLQSEIALMLLHGMVCHIHKTIKKLTQGG